MLNLIIIFIVSFALIIFYAYRGTVLNSKISSNLLKWNRYYTYSFIILLLLMGLREGVGRDWYAYYGNYFNKNLFRYFQFGESTEFGNGALIWVLKGLGFHAQSYFFFTSLITIYLLYTYFKNLYFLLPFALLVFFTDGLFVFSLNGIRQGIAIIAFLNVMRFPIENYNFKENSRNFLNIIFYFFVGLSFHYSIVAYVPFIFLNNKIILRFFNSKILIIIVLSGFLINVLGFASNFEGITSEYFPKYSDYFLFDKYANYGKKIFGIGSTLYLMMYLIPFFYFDKIKKKYKNVEIYFVLFAFGLFLQYTIFTEDVMLINRLIKYLLAFSIIVLSLGINYFMKYNRKYYTILLLFSVSLLIVKLFIKMPLFMELEIIKNNFSLFLLPLMK